MCSCRRRSLGRRASYVVESLARRVERADQFVTFMFEGSNVGGSVGRRGKLNRVHLCALVVETDEIGAERDGVDAVVDGESVGVVGPQRGRELAARVGGLPGVVVRFDIDGRLFNEVDPIVDAAARQGGVAAVVIEGVAGEHEASVDAEALRLVDRAGVAVADVAVIEISTSGVGSCCRRGRERRARVPRGRRR